VPGAGTAWSERRSSTAIATFRVEAAGKGARAFHEAPRPVRRSRTRIAHVPAKLRANARTVWDSAGSVRSWAPPCVAAARGSPNTGPTTVDDRRPRSSNAVTRIVTSRRGRSTSTENRRRRSPFSATSRRPTNTRIRRVPGETVPASRPKLASCGAGATSAGGGSAAMAKGSTGQSWPGSTTSGGWSDAGRAEDCRPRRPTLRVPPAPRRR